MSSNIVPLLNILDQGICYGIVGLQHQHGFHLFEKHTNTIEEYQNIFNFIFLNKLLVNPTKVVIGEDVLIKWKTKELIIKALIGMNIKVEFIFNCVGSAMLMTHKSALVVKMNSLETYCIPVVHGYPEFKALQCFNMGEDYFVNLLRNLIKQHGHIVRTDLLRKEASVFLHPRKGLTKDTDGRPVLVLDWENERAKEFLSFSHLQRLLSICFIQPEPTSNEMDLKEVTKSTGSIKTVYKLPVYKSTLGWIVIPAYLNSRFAYCIPGWIIERIYEGWFEGNQDSCTLADLILSSLLKTSTDARILAANNIIIQYPYSTPIYGLIGRLNKSIKALLPKYKELKGIAKHLNIRLFVNKIENQVEGQELDSRMSDMTINSFTLEFCGLSVLLNNPTYQAQQVYEVEEDVQNIIEWIR